MRDVATKRLIELFRHQLKQKRQALSLKQNAVRLAQENMHLTREKCRQEAEIVKTLPPLLSGAPFFQKMQKEKKELEEHIKTLKNDLLPLMQEVKNLFQQVKAHETAHARDLKRAVFESLSQEEKGLEDIRSSFRKVTFLS